MIDPEPEEPGLDDFEDQRPRTRGDCLEGGVNAHRPCPWVSCRYHLALEVDENSGAVDGRDPTTIPQTCALDVADEGGATLDEIGTALGLTREGVRQVERKASKRAKGRALLLGLDQPGREYPTDPRAWMLREEGAWTCASAMAALGLQAPAIRTIADGLIAKGLLVRGEDLRYHRPQAPAFKAFDPSPELLAELRARSARTTRGGTVPRELPHIPSSDFQPPQPPPAPLPAPEVPMPITAEHQKTLDSRRVWLREHPRTTAKAAGEAWGTTPQNARNWLLRHGTTDEPGIYSVRDGDEQEPAPVVASTTPKKASKAKPAPKASTTLTPATDLRALSLDDLEVWILAAALDALRGLDSILGRHMLDRRKQLTADLLGLDQMLVRRGELRAPFEPVPVDASEPKSQPSPDAPVCCECHWGTCGECDTCRAIEPTPPVPVATPKPDDNPLGDEDLGEPVGTEQFDEVDEPATP